MCDSIPSANAVGIDRYSNLMYGSVMTDKSHTFDLVLLDLFNQIKYLHFLAPDVAPKCNFVASVVVFSRL